LSKQAVDNSGAQNSDIGNPCAETVNVERATVLESRHSNYGSWQRAVGGAQLREQALS